jgi:hypothetical protein
LSLLVLFPLPVLFNSKRSAIIIIRNGSMLKNEMRRAEVKVRPLYFLLLLFNEVFILIAFITLTNERIYFCLSLELFRVTLTLSKKNPKSKKQEDMVRTLVIK